MTLVTHSVDEVAEAIGKGPEWVLKRVKDFKHLQVGRTPRFTPEQAEAFIASFTVQPGTEATDKDGDGEDPLRSQVSRTK